MLKMISPLKMIRMKNTASTPKHPHHDGVSRLEFKLEKKATGSHARATTFRTLHNVVQTPVFMPVGTLATVRSQTRETLEETGAQVLLANTYHLFLRPGPEVFKKMGGIHRFMNWSKSVLTDSGGFQIFSLENDRNITEEGATFQSYVDGTKFLLTPELSIETQKAIGSDIMMVLDECVPSTCDRTRAEKAMHLTHRWAKRSLHARGDSQQGIFGIVQGACFEDLRRQSAEVITSMPFDGFAIGGLAVGETKSERENFCELTASLLPENRPRYLMGVGTPIDLLEAVHRGVDMFDCILPTSLAQQGIAFTSLGKLDLKRAPYKFADMPLDPACECPTCRDFSRAYLHHLVKCREVLGWRLIGQHNLSFYHRLMASMRSAILEDRFTEFYRNVKPSLECDDPENPKTQPLRKPKKVDLRRLGDYEVVESLPTNTTANAPDCSRASRSSIHSDSKKIFYKIRHVSSGETMHALEDPLDESKRLYIQQPRFSELVRRTVNKSVQKNSDDNLNTFVIWDVGLGSATNAMAAISEYENLEKNLGTQTAEDVLKPLHIISFERDLDPLKLTLEYHMCFPHIHHKSPHQLLKNKEWTSPSGLIRWTLVHADFQEVLNSSEKLPVPQLIFYDPFSYKTDAPLWSLDAFEKLMKKLQASETDSASPCLLITYSASTAVRSALLSSGFWVAAGLSIPPKYETTVAFTRPAMKWIQQAGLSPLDSKWLAHWHRSDAKIPYDVRARANDEEIQAIQNRITQHPQFLTI